MVNAMKGFKFPKKLGHCLEQLANIQHAVEKLQAELAPWVEREALMREHLLVSFNKAELNGARGHGLVCAISKSTVPNLKDWKKFLRYAMKPGNDDLLQRSVNTPAWRERSNAEKAVPGVEPFNRVVLRVSKEKGK